VAGRYGYAGSGQVDAPGQRKLVVDVATNTVCRTISPANAVRPKSFIDDVRVNGKHAYLADAGAPALLMLDLSTSQPRRFPWRQAWPGADSPLQRGSLEKADVAIARRGPLHSTVSHRSEPKPPSLGRGHRHRCFGVHQEHAIPIAPGRNTGSTS